MSVVVAESDVFNFSLDIVWDVFQGPFKDTEVGATFHFHGADRVLSELSETDHVVAYTTGPRTDRYALRGVTEDDTTVVEVSVTFDEGTDASVVDECKAGLPGKLLHIGQMVKRTYWTAARVRDTFVNFFVEKKDHKNIKSSSVVPHSDPTLLFANAGMNQFKPIFLGQVVPGSWMDGLRRASNTQKCIRAGGKHNDLEDVGKDVYHHTFFEMLGNWSFGDYFKKEAIAWAWELLTKVYRLDPTRLYATYFGGDEAMGLPADDEAREIWLQFLPESHILPFDKKDNFWEMGATGPCGPCTELHFDRIGNRECPELVNMDDPDVLEIWNLVCWQRKSALSLVVFFSCFFFFPCGFHIHWVTLPGLVAFSRCSFNSTAFPINPWTRCRPSRLTPEWVSSASLPCCRTSAPTTTPTSLLASSAPSRSFAARASRRTRAVSGRMTSAMLTWRTFRLQHLEVAPRVSSPPRCSHVKWLCVCSPDPCRYRVLADHVRTLTFAITDGAVPGNNGRNYVLRRILRRAVRYGQQILKCKPGFFVKLVPVVNEVFGHAFPELGPRVKYVEEIIEDEEETFGRTLSRGVKLFNRHLADLKEAGAKEFPGKIAFQLYDTYGFPYDLTELMAEEEGLTTDAAGYEAAMSEQQERGRNARVEEGFDLALQQEQTLFLSTSDVPVTDDEPKYDWYKVHDSALRAIFVPGEGGRVDHVDEVTAGETVIGVVMNSTPFYAEAGGQVFDTGFIVSGLSVDAKESTDHELDQAVEEAAVRFAVQKVVKFAGYVLHVGRLEVGSLSVGTEVSAVVDYERRALVAPNHTMTHMLNFALRKVLGQECDQKGSDNDTKRARCVNICSAVLQCAAMSLSNATDHFSSPD